VISKRLNSAGETTYLVRATEDELLSRENALVSKALRNLILKILPGDIVEEAIDALKKLRDAKIDQDPDGERKKILDAFSSIGVPVDELKSYVGSDLGAIDKATIKELRDLFAAVKTGESSWKEIFAEHTSSKEEPSDEKAEPKKPLADKIRAASKKTAKAEPKPGPIPNEDVEDVDTNPIDPKVHDAAMKEVAADERQTEIHVTPQWTTLLESAGDWKKAGHDLDEWRTLNQDAIQSLAGVDYGRLNDGLKALARKS
jgi:hypothetical protein